jgi:nucleoside 2-deoxyribosyltransferase
MAVDRIICEANGRVIRRADLGIFNLTPFRGSSADVGTVFELGLMTGLKKPAIGYTNCARSLRERVPGAIILASACPDRPKPGFAKIFCCFFSKMKIFLA